MSALVERIIFARDSLNGLNISDYGIIRQARHTLADAANALTEREARIKALEGWWYEVPEEQRFTIMADAAWKRHEAAGPK